MASRPFIPDAPLLDDQGRITAPWLQWFRIAGVTIAEVRSAGPSTQRPTSGIRVGQQYYDTTLNKPIYVYDVAMVAAGSGGWADANGLTV